MAVFVSVAYLGTPATAATFVCDTFVAAPPPR